MWGGGLGRGRGMGRGIFPVAPVVPPSSPGKDTGPVQRTTSIWIGRGRGVGPFVHVSKEEPFERQPTSTSPAASQLSPLVEEEASQQQQLSSTSPAATYSPSNEDQEAESNNSNEERETEDEETSAEPKHDDDSHSVSTWATTTEYTESFETFAEGLKPIIKRGERGTKSHYTTNFIKLTVASGKGMYEYHVGFTPDVEHLQFRKLLIRELAVRKDISNVRMFDGATLFLPEKLPLSRMEYSTVHPASPEEVVIVTIRFVKEKKPQDCVQFYNILLNRVMEELGLIQLKRNFFDIRITHIIPQHKLEIWPGYCVKVDVQEGGLMLSLDSSHRVLRQETAYDMYKVLKISGNPEWKKIFEEQLVGSVVLTRYNNNSYRVDEVLWLQTPLSTFIRKGKQISYVDYYQDQYNQRIKDMEQPLLLSRVKPKRNAKEADVSIVCLVPQLCFLTGLTDEQRQNFQIMKDIAHYTRLSPAQRVSGLNAWLGSLMRSERATLILQDWGLRVANEACQVEGRILTGPSITFSQRCLVKEATADFSKESGSNCFNPVELKSWAVIVCQKDSELARRMVDTYRQVCQQLGIRFAPPTVTTMKYGAVADYVRILKDLTLTEEEFEKQAKTQDPCTLVRHKPFQFILAVFASLRDDIYAALKKFLVSERGVPSQVILAKTLRNDKRLRSVMTKVALQINCKLGGAIWSLNMPLKDNIMIVGIDVSHDPMKRNPSVTAMVSTMENSCTKYYSRVSVQKPHQELVDVLKPLFKDALTAYHKGSGGFPSRIVIFRDGIGDGQIDTAAQSEVNQFLDVIKEDCPELKHFTFVVVQKRIGERFYMFNKGRNENPPPGSVIDHTITRRSYYDFFIASQLVRQGTVTPTHFVVVHDRGDIRPDLIQKLAYAMTFMYFNWPGTIRVPAVCQYAHKLAFLIGQHVKAEPHDSMKLELYYL